MKVVKMIDHELEFVYLHIHRCAGASIEQFFNNSTIYDHRQIQHYVKQFGKDTWENYYSFAIIRNPWSKVVSHYFWRQQRAWWYAPGDELSFEDWIKNFDAIKENLGDKNEPQVSWLSYQDHEVDKVVKLSDLDEKWPEICEDIGIEPKPLPEANVTCHKHYSHYYDEETKDIVADWYEDDLKEFDFKFQDKRKAEQRLEALGYM